MEAAHAALATAAAPTYFSAAKVGNMVSETEYFDGGVWASSPVMAALVEATCYLNVPMDRIDILSVGTTEEPFSVQNRAQAGAWGWGLKLLDLLMKAQEEATQMHARLLAGKPRYLRVNVTTSPGAYSLDSSDDIGKLAALGNREANKPEVLDELRSRFLNGVSVSKWENF
jgi:patatin-like phospholipase/acyl hydrolase